MAQITVRANDSASAMEKIIKELGDDAMIVSTRKVDHEIEITATNDLNSPGAKKKKDDVITQASEKNNFSQLFRNKLAQSSDGENGDLEHSDVDPMTLIENLQKQLVQLSRLIETNHPSKGEESNFVKLNRLGLNVAVNELLNDVDPTASIEDITKAIAKAFVSGRSEYFDMSDVYFVIGLQGAGKSIFIEKFEYLLKSQHDKRSVVKFSPIKFAKDFDKIIWWSEKNSQKSENRREIALVEICAPEIFESQLFRLKSSIRETNFSIINVCSAGSSYDFIKKNIRRPTFDNEYLVISKLDLCDISLSEIGAYVELGHKCNLFSGTTHVDTGLYYARVDQIQSHINLTLQTGNN